MLVLENLSKNISYYVVYCLTKYLTAYLRTKNPSAAPTPADTPFTQWLRLPILTPVPSIAKKFVWILSRTIKNITKLTTRSSKLRSLESPSSAASRVSIFCTNTFSARRGRTSRRRRMVRGSWGSVTSKWMILKSGLRLYPKSLNDEVFLEFLEEVQDAGLLNFLAEALLS